MHHSKTRGMLLAASAAALFSTAGIVHANEAVMAGDQVKCSGINACKGMSECATATSSCKGHNSCKGSGWLYTTKADCDDQGGTVMEDTQ